MSKHAHSKNSTVGAVIMLLILSGLVVWGIGLMNSADYVSAGLAGVILFLFGLYTVLVLGKE